MSLKYFHVFFIGTSVALFTLLGVWFIDTHTLWATISLLVAGGLISYGLRFWQKMKMIVTGSLLLVSSEVLACRTCMANAPIKDVEGISFSILTLGAIILAVLGGVGLFIVHLRNRARAYSAGERD